MLMWRTTVRQQAPVALSHLRHTCLCTYIDTHVYTHVHIHMSIHMSIHMMIHTPICVLCACLYTCPLTDCSTFGVAPLEVFGSGVRLDVGGPPGEWSGR